MALPLSELGIGIVVFAATDIDDLLIIAAFMADPAMRVRAIVAGQYLGIAALVATSALLASLALAIPAGWVALLGFVPLIMGIRGFLAARGAIGGKTDREENEGFRDEERRAEGRLHSQALAVAGVTVANGGDNLGVYVPLFSAAFDQVAVYAAVFAVMTGVWCILGHFLVNHPVVGARIRRHGSAVLPFVLVALGVYILSGARVLLR